MKTTISDRYEVNLDSKDAVIGKGGQAVVYRGYDRVLQLEVAIKIYKLADYTENIRALRREYEQMQRFNHPNVVQYLDWAVFTHQKKILFALVMTYADLGTLDQYQANLKAGNLANLKEVFIGILNGLKHIHQLGIVHRDLKPSNILLTAQTDRGIAPVITDFLMESRVAPQDAKVATAHFNGFFGTIEYMAPELLGTKNVFVGPASDLWSFGVLVYEVLMGELPFGSRANDSQPFRVAQSILTQPVDTAEIPQPYNFVVEACLEKDLSSRISEAQILIDIIDKYELDGGKVSLNIRKKQKQEILPTATVPADDDATIVGFVNVQKQNQAKYIPPTILLDATMPAYGTMVMQETIIGTRPTVAVDAMVPGKTYVIPQNKTVPEAPTPAHLGLLDEIQQLKEKIEALENEKDHYVEQQAFSKQLFQDWIAENEMATCFAELNKIKASFSHQLTKTYIMIRAEWSELKMQEMHGIIEAQRLKTNANQIRYKLLNFLDLVEIGG